MKYMSRRLLFAAALGLSTACSVDPTKLACNSSAECPTGYHCELTTLKCQKGASQTTPTLLDYTWDKTTLTPGGVATLTFTGSEQLKTVVLSPDTPSRNIQASSATLSTASAPNTYKMTFTMPADCSGAAGNPSDGVPVPVSLQLTDLVGMNGAGSVGALTCVVAKTITANPAKFKLLKKPYPDGTVRSTIGADAGAVSSSPSFTGLRVFAQSGSTVLGSASVASDGSVLQFELPGAPTQVALTVQDQAGTSVPVTAYPETLIMSFVGKEVAGNSNPTKAFDVATATDSIYAPQYWLTSGPGPSSTGGPKELLPNFTMPSSGPPATNTNSYGALNNVDAVFLSTSAPAQPSDTSVVGWQQFPAAPPRAAPSARVGAAMAGSGTFYLFGGATPDSGGVPADPQGSLYSLDGSGWTFISAPTSGTLPQVASGAAAGPGGFSSNCAGSICDYYGFQLVIAGGFCYPGSFCTGTMDSAVYAYGPWTHCVGATCNTNPAWFNLGSPMIVPNASMASAPGQVPIWNATAGRVDNWNGMMLVGGQGITAANNDTNACTLVAAFSGSSISSQALSCLGTSGDFAQLTGAIGYRQGASLVSGNQTFYLFGGNKIGGTVTGLQNDVWKGTVSCTGVSCATTTTWTKLSPTGASIPAPRRRAGAAMWALNRILIYGGFLDTTDTNPANDLWELDVSTATPSWRQVAVDSAAAALKPATRSRFTMVGDQSSYRAYVFGGTLGTTPTDQLWLIGKEAVARLLVKAPVTLSSLSSLTVNALTVRAVGLASWDQAFLWSGGEWRFIGSGDPNSFPPFSSIPLSLSPLAPASFIQPDGNLYLLLMSSFRSTPGSASTSTITSDTLEIGLDFK